MVRIGWLQDTHTKHDPTLPVPGAQQELIDAYNYLDTAKHVDTIVHGGDVCHPEDETADPHVRPRAYDRFFDLVEQTNDPTLLSHLVPGNHDTPLATFVEADDRCTLRRRVEFPGESVTMVLLNTHINSIVTGSPGSDSQGGVGTEYARVSRADVKWLDKQLADAGSNAKLVVPHASLTPLPECEYASVNGYRGEINDRSAYNIVMNHKYVHGTLSKHENVVVPVSHLYQFADEGSQVIDDVSYAWKRHYWKGSDNSFYTYGYIDIDGTGCTITTVDQSTRNETTILDTTF